MRDCFSSYSKEDIFRSSICAYQVSLHTQSKDMLELPWSAVVRWWLSEIRRVPVDTISVLLYSTTTIAKYLEGVGPNNRIRAAMIAYLVLNNGS